MSSSSSAFSRSCASWDSQVPSRSVLDTMGSPPGGKSETTKLPKPVLYPHGRNPARGRLPAFRAEPPLAPAAVPDGRSLPLAQACRQPSASTASARAVVASGYRSETVPPVPTGTSAYPTSAPDRSLACIRHTAGPVSRLVTVSRTATDESLICSTVTWAWYGGLPYRPYKRPTSLNAATRATATSTAGSQRRTGRGSRRRPYRPGGNTGAPGVLVTMCWSSQEAVVPVSKNGRVP